MKDRCISHQFEDAQGYCRHCRHPFCQACLVWPFGENSEPLCIACALTAAGVRRGAQRRPATRAERRSRDHGRRRDRRQHQRTNALGGSGRLSDEELEEVAELPTLGDLVTLSAAVERPSASTTAEPLSAASAAEALPFLATVPEPVVMAPPPPPPPPPPRPVRTPQHQAPRPIEAEPAAAEAFAPLSPQESRAAGQAAPPPFEPAPPRKFNHSPASAAGPARPPLAIAPLSD